MPRVAIVTLGCPKNAIDSEGLGGLLDAAGHELVDDPHRADVVLVNTCGFIDPARAETIEEILGLAELKQDDGLKGLVLTGCLVARSADELEQSLPEVDALVDFAAYPRIGDIVERVAAGSLEHKIHGEPGTRFDPAWWDASLQSGPRIRFGRRPWAYVKIAEGCDRGCTFCAIPLMRGKFMSRPPEIIETEIRRLADAGVSEISLVSQDLVMWGRDTDGGDLLALLRRLERIDGIRRIRLMYLHPHGVTDRLIDAIATSEVIASYFDLSLQHVSPRVLKGMGRWGGRARFERMIERIRSVDPAAGIRTTFILGFPGESDADAGDVESFVADTEIDWVGVFTYSREQGTRSFGLPDQIPDYVARARAERVSAAAELTMDRRARALVGETFKVLVERFDVQEEAWVGRSQREAPEIDGEITFTSEPPLKVGDYVDVRITANEGADLTGAVAD